MILAAVFHDDPGQRCHVVVGADPVRLGRGVDAEGDDFDGDTLRIPWTDRVVNRNHSIAVAEGETLVVTRLTPPAETNRSAPNPFYSNAPLESRHRLDDPLRLEPGQSFVIGGHGRTSFFWLRSLDELDTLLETGRKDSEPRHREFERARNTADDYDRVSELDEYAMRFQLRLLQKELPEKVLRGWTDEEDLFTRTSDFLQSALPGQKGVSAAFVALCQDSPERPYEILHTSTSSLANFRPSKTLVRQLLEASHSPAAGDEAFVWSSEDHDFALSDHSFVGEIDWVVAVPLASLEKGAPVFRDDGNRPVYLYVETRRASDASARAFVPFLRLMASLVSSLLSARQRQRVQDQMSAYFSPALRRHLREGDQAALALTVTDCTVIFCDRRASSKYLERARSDEALLETLRDNQDFVSEITQIVFDQDGVITDFAGDGVLAIWGWPAKEGGTANHALQGIDAAEAIAHALASRVESAGAGGVRGRDSGSAVAAFRIGISTGRVAVGITGPKQQMHISVFGSVVNFGARLEGLGKQFHVPVLLSEETANLVGDRGKAIRKLCYLKPAGFDQSYAIYELVLPCELGGSGATPEDIAVYEDALGVFLARHWDRCLDLLGTLPPDDAPARWLARQATHFRQSPPPADWAGEVVSLTK